MSVTSPPPPAAPEVAARPIPWEDPDLSGGFERFIETVKGLASAPGDTFRRMPTDAGIARPLFYAVLVSWIGLGAGFFWFFILQMLSVPFMDMGDDLGLGIGILLATALITIVVLPLFVILGIFIAAAVLHLMLLIVGAANNGFEATVRVVCYAQTVQLANAIPICGGLVSAIWGLVLYIVGIAAGHRTTHGKAVLAVLLPGVLFCVFAAVMLSVALGLIAAQTQ